MTRSEHILEAARSLRPELAELIGGADADALDRELAELIARANAGALPDADRRILRLLQEREETMEWVSDYLEERFPPEVEESNTRGFQSLPGAGSPLPGDATFRCPENDFVWVRRTVGTPVPLCHTHHIPLVRDPGPEAA
jgi:hypothetical protein